MTPPASVLLDSDTLSAITRNHSQAVANSRAYLQTHPRLSISIITRFEVLRGLKVKSANRQLTIFENFCVGNEVFDITDSIIVKAADIYADLHKRGLLIGDADILIAATALVHGYAVATNNERHFQRIPGLQLENWLK